jgi:hypothetical protein
VSDFNSGKTTPGLYNEGLMADRGHPIASTKTLSIHFYFYPFCSNSLFQTPIPFSLHPGGGLRRSRWPCRPRTTLRRTSPDGVPPGEAIQGDRREFAHHPEADGQTATRRGQTTSPYSPTANAWSRGPRPCFGYTRMCLCSGGKTFSVNTLFGNSTGENL